MKYKKKIEVCKYIYFRKSKYNNIEIKNNFLNRYLINKDI